MGGAAKTNLVNYQGRIQGGGQRGKCPGPRPVKGGSELSHFSNLKLKSEEHKKNWFADRSPNEKSI